MTSKHIGWWIYFWLFMTNLIAPLFWEPLNLEGLAALLFGAVALLGLWGYLRNRPIVHSRAWAAFFFALLLVMAYSVIRPFFVDAHLRSWALAGAATGILFCIPLLLALWRYSFRSPDLWRASTAA